MLGSPGIVLLLEVEHAEIAAKNGEIALNGNRLLIVGDGGRLIRLRLNKSQLVQGVIVLWILPQGSARPLLRALVVTGVDESAGKAGHGLVEGGIEFQTALEMIGGFLPLLFAEAGFPEEKRNDIHAGIGGADLGEQLAGGFGIAGVKGIFG